MLKVDRIVKRFGATAAVDGVEFELGENEFFALLGPSGCGKTTLLRIIAGFETPDSGQIWLNGRDVTRQPPERRPVNMMFQSYALFDHMTVEGNVAYGLEMERLPRDRIAARVDAMLETAQIGALRARKPAQLSGGQRQRVALARALVKHPQLLLLDEPLAALDRKLREQMQLELKRLQSDAGISFVMVTHDQEEALAMANRIAVMKDGRVVQMGPPSDLYQHPRSRFVASFVGKMNFFPGKRAGAGVASAALGRLGAHGLDCAPDEGADAVLAVRPERMRIAPARPDGHNAVEGTVLDSAYHGQDNTVTLAADGADAPVLVRISSETDRVYAQGERVLCCWLPKDSLVLKA